MLLLFCSYGGVFWGTITSLLGFALVIFSVIPEHLISATLFERLTENIYAFW
jgi:hypothetical protein